MLAISPVGVSMNSSLRAAVTCSTSGTRNGNSVKRLLYGSVASAQRGAQRSGRGATIRAGTPSRPADGSLSEGCVAASGSGTGCGTAERPKIAFASMTSFSSTCCKRRLCSKTMHALAQQVYASERAVRELRDKHPSGSREQRCTKTG